MSTPKDSDTIADEYSEDEGFLNSPTCIACGWHPGDEGHDDDCPLSATWDEGK